MRSFALLCHTIGSFWRKSCLNSNICQFASYVGGGDFGVQPLLELETLRRFVFFEVLLVNLRRVGIRLTCGLRLHIFCGHGFLLKFVAVVGALSRAENASAVEFSDPVWLFNKEGGAVVMVAQFCISFLAESATSLIDPRLNPHMIGFVPGTCRHDRFGISHGKVQLVPRSLPKGGRCGHGHIHEFLDFIDLG